MYMNAKSNPHPEPRVPFASTVPPTPAEEAVISVSWERRGLLNRLVRLP